jgi:FLVCR family feline leukemia virus subgroup C receptor-related protein
VSAGTIPLIILARDKPPTPPSPAASRKEEKLDFLKELRVLVRNPSYILLSICYMTMDSICTAMGAIVASLTKPYQYSSTANALSGGIFIVFGVLGSFLISVLLDKYQKFKITILGLAVLSVISTALATVTLPYRNVPLFLANVSVMGFAAIPMTPIAFAFAVELTYPTPEAMSNGMMGLVNKIYGSVMSILAAYIC